MYLEGGKEGIDVCGDRRRGVAFALRSDHPPHLVAELCPRRLAALGGGEEMVHTQATTVRLVGIRWANPPFRRPKAIIV